MKLELIVLGVTGFLVANTYHDGKYLKYLKVNKKYFQMATYAFIGLSFYLFMKKHPSQSNNMLKYANGMVKHLPIDKNTSDMITPLFDMTSQHYAMSQMGATQMNAQQLGQTPQQRRMMRSGAKSRTKRSVSETKKKFVAAEQNWCCALCKKKLPAWFEVDHTISLENGGTNHVSNLRALCRDCHGRKTAMENL